MTAASDTPVAQAAGLDGQAGAETQTPAPGHSEAHDSSSFTSYTWIWKPWLLCGVLLVLLAPNDVVGQFAAVLNLHVHALKYRPRLRGVEASREPLFVLYGNIERYWGNYVVKEFSTVAFNLSTAYGWKRYIPVDGDHPSWDQLAWDLTVDFGRLPDVILFLQDWQLFDPVSRPRKGSLLEDSVLFNWFDDIPATTGKAWAGGILNQVDVMFPCYEYLLPSRIPSVTGVHRIWHPHSAMPVFIQPLHASPRNKVLLVGNTDPEGYPMRWIVVQKINAGDSRFEQYQHPGWQPGPSHDHQRDMAVTMSGYVAAIADGSNNNFVVGKCLEIPATGTLMLMSADIQEPLAALGFVSGTHYLSYSKETMDSVVDWVLDPKNREKVDAMRAAGQAVAHARHQTHHRTQTFHEAALAVYAHRDKPKAQRLGALPKPFRVVSEWGPWTDPNPLAAQSKMEM